MPPNMMGRIREIRGIPKNLHVNYRRLQFNDRKRAEDYFKAQTAKYPCSAWMEKRFLQTVGIIALGQTVSKMPAKDIKPINIKDPQFMASYIDFGRDEERYRQIGKQAIENGELMAIDLCAGMATGFDPRGTVAKASVRFQMDARGSDPKGITYLDIKRSNYLDLQKASKRHFIAAEMVSDMTDKDVRENLRNFAEKNGMQLIIIEESMPTQEIKKVWESNKNRWDQVMIVPIVRQPSTLYVSEDARHVDGEYMKGHGDFYDVVKHHLKNVMHVMGIKYVFSSNIDNTGALVSRTVLGYFVEQMQQEEIEAMMEAAEKYLGDKGGVPALIRGKFSLLEGPFVPDEWKDRFNGKEVFPYFNTNTFWFSADALLKNKFNLPLLTTKIIDDKFLKIESIMGHGLESLKWKALVVDRGLRFLPAKYLTDVWVGRTDWIRWFHNRLLPIMRAGKYVPKPLLEVSKTILGGVEDLNRRIFGFGAYDSMKSLNTLIMGGEGKSFNRTGDFMTKCAVNYIGDVAIVFEYKEGRPSGTLIIQGSSESDEITLEDSIIFVPAGEAKIIKDSKKNEIDPNLKAEDFREFIANAASWTEEKRKHVVDKFYPSSERVVSLEVYEKSGYIKYLSDIAKDNLNVLKKVFEVKGSYSYDVALITDEKVVIKVAEDSKAGTAAKYESRADGQEVSASARKAFVIREGNRIYLETEGDVTFVGIPKIRDGKVVALHMLMGNFNEAYSHSSKAELLRVKFEQVVGLLENRGIKDKELISKFFCEISWQFLLEFSPNDIAAHIIKKYNAKVSSNDK